MHKWFVHRSFSWLSASGLQIGFLTPNFTNVAFLEVVGVKKIAWLFGFFSSIFGFFGNSSHMLSDWCLSFLIKILLKSVIITGSLRQCFVYFLFKHVALPVRPIHHKLMQFIGMSSSKWKSSYDKGRIHNSNGKRHFFRWRTRKPMIVQKMHIASHATLELYQGTDSSQ